jgi:hypothetical protein
VRERGATFLASGPAPTFSDSLTVAGIAKFGYSGPKVWPLRRRFESKPRWDRPLPVPAASTLNTPLHTLNCTAFAIASEAENILPKGPGPRAV